MSVGFYAKLIRYTRGTVGRLRYHILIGNVHALKAPVTKILLSK